MSEERTRTATGTLTDEVRENPVDKYLAKSRRKRFCYLLLLIVLVVVGWLVWRFTSDRPVVYADIDEHYKYGSIGSEPGVSLAAPAGGVLPPYWVFKVLPEICPEKIPGGYAALGLIYEPGRDLPIGVSRRWRLGFDQVGLNCASCHTGTVRETPSSPQKIVLGMPSHQFDIEEFFRFLLDCSLDERLTADNLLGKIEEQGGDFERPRPRPLPHRAGQPGEAHHPAPAEAHRHPARGRRHRLGPGPGRHLQPLQVDPVQLAARQAAA